MDYYIVNRTRHLSSGPVTTRLQAESNFLEIDGREPDVVESYTVQSVRLGYESPLSNVITIGTGSLLGVECAEPLWAVGMQGAMRIITGGEQSGIIVTDPSGKTVLTLERAGINEVIPMPAGIYLVRSAHSPTPVKVLVK